MRSHRGPDVSTGATTLAAPECQTGAFPRSLGPLCQEREGRLGGHNWETPHWLPKTRPLRSHTSRAPGELRPEAPLVSAGFHHRDTCIWTTGGAVLPRGLGRFPREAAETVNYNVVNFVNRLFFAFKCPQGPPCSGYSALRRAGLGRKSHGRPTGSPRGHVSWQGPHTVPAETTGPPGKARDASWASRRAGHPLQRSGTSARGPHRAGASTRTLFSRRFHPERELESAAYAPWGVRGGARGGPRSAGVRGRGRR